MTDVTPEILAQLVDGRLPWTLTKEIMSGHKDGDRFEKYLALRQSRVPWPERILLALGEHLSLVVRGGQRFVKCDCGHELGEASRHWKWGALIHVRDSREAMLELYPDHQGADTALCQLREYFCPGCATLLEVDAVPPGYPIVEDFVPDVDAFYRRWLGREVPTG
ncbi:MAG: acetone carboxylase subunit gamma [Candidatus Rokubacteria bacterium]|nr:acetone carboxylase subunit gamma [Candidatus Rokubacteria bacterium]